MKRLLGMLVAVFVFCGTMVGYGNIVPVHADTVKSFTDITGLKLLDVAYSAELNLYVAVGNDGTNGKIFVSNDGGITWILRKSDAPKFISNASLNSDTESTRQAQRERNVVWSKSYGRFFIICASGAQWMTSSDGVKWAKMTVPCNFDYITADDYGVLATRFFKRVTSGGVTTGDGLSHVYKMPADLNQSSDLSAWSEIGVGVGSRRFAMTNNKTTPYIFYFRRLDAYTANWYFYDSKNSAWAKLGGSGAEPAITDVTYSAVRKQYLLSYQSRANQGVIYQGIAAVNDPATPWTAGATGLPAAVDGFYDTTDHNSTSSSDCNKITTGTSAIANNGTIIAVGCMNGKIYTTPEEAPQTGTTTLTEVVAADSASTNASQITSLVVSPDNTIVAVAGSNLVRVVSTDGVNKYTLLNQYVNPTIEIEGINYTNSSSTVTTLAGKTSVDVAAKIKTSASSQPVAFVAALYDSTGKMKYVGSYSKNIANTDTSATDFKVTVSDNGNDLAGYKIRTFIWNDMQTMQPFFGPTEFKQ